MIGLSARITPLSAFGTLPKGDTFFGQICWALRNADGESRLRELLHGYTDGHPFAVISDALPSGYLPRPALPVHWLAESDPSKRKEAKKRVWLPLIHFDKPLADWQQHFIEPNSNMKVTTKSQPHNVINRRTGTTGSGFAPYVMTQYWYTDHSLDIFINLDDSRLSLSAMRSVLESIGAFGFGRDASIGLGKFRLDSLEVQPLREQRNANAWLTLAPCAIQDLDLNRTRSFYHVFTRFGRHGDVAVHTGKPFKSPLLLAQTGAILTPTDYRTKPFVGHGLGGNGVLSNAIKETVHQGYAPVIGINLPDSWGVAA